MQLEIDDALGDRGAGPRQKTRAHAIGGGAQPQIEARRLDLPRRERIMRANAAVRRQFRDHAVGQDSFVRWRERQRHAITISFPPPLAGEEPSEAMAKGVSRTACASVAAAGPLPTLPRKRGRKLLIAI